MESTDRRGISLFHHNEADIRVFLFTLAASILIHLAFVVALIFASEYTPAPPLSTSVIDVSVVSLPETQAPPGPAAPPEPVAEPEATAPPSDPLTQAELEALLMEQQSTPPPPPEPEPTPQPVPEPTPPAPDPAGDQVVIDPEEPKEPPPEAPPEKEEPAPAPEQPPEAPAPVPVKAPKFNKPAKPPKAVEAPAPDQDAVRKAIADIQKKIARRTEGRYQVKPEPTPETPTPSSGDGVSQGASGTSGDGAIGIQAKAAITSYAGSVLPDRINRNWAFSEHLASRRFNLEAVLVIRIRADGEIVDIWFEKKSGDRYFDNSAYNAVVKSNPLPPLPRAYTAYADTYTIGLRFTPSGLN